MRNILVVALAGMLILGGCGKGKGSVGTSSGGANGDFDRIKTGMSIDEVTAIMGAPKAQVAAGEITQLHWEKDTSHMMVQFKDGKVFNKMFVKDAAGDSKKKKHDSAKDQEPEPKADAKPDKKTDAKAAAKADEASANFEKIKTGMSTDEVTAIMGAPKTQVSAGEMTQYHWEKGAATMLVQFKDGKVFNKVFSADRAGSAAGSGKQKDFAKIKVGMTRDEVTWILGRPTQEYSGTDGTTNGGMQQWTDGKATLTVGYKDNKVMIANVNNEEE